jgi:Flp pilus assembly secretin CpaC
MFSFITVTANYISGSGREEDRVVLSYVWALEHHVKGPAKPNVAFPHLLIFSGEHTTFLEGGKRG